MEGTALKLPTLTRELTPEITLRAEEGVTRLTFPASSETPVERWFGEEVLSHEGSAVRMERIKRGAVPMLFNHDWDDPIGMIDAARIEDSRLVVDAHLFETPRAAEIAAMLRGGLRNVSLGYRLHVVEEDKKKNTFTARDWEPFEVSIVTIPADPTVGIGRSQPGGEELEVRMIRASQPAAPAANQEKSKMDGNQAAAAGASAEVKDDEYLRVDPAAEAKKRRDAIEKFARASGVTDTRTIEHWIRSGKDWDQIGTDLLKIREENSKAAASFLDLPAKDVQRYSLWRAMNAVLSGDWRHAGLELEASREIANRTQRMHNAKGFFVPLDVQQRQVQLNQDQRRDLTVASASGGGYLVATDNMSFIELLRNRMVALRMGATRMPGLVGNVTVPKQTAGATAYWLATEGTAITEGALTFGQMALSPKTVGAYVEVSRNLLMQSNPAAEGIVTFDLASQVARAGDLAVLHGTGTEQPTGITQTGSIGSVTGTSLAYAGIIEFQTDVAANNVSPLRGGYVTTPAVAGLLKARNKVTNDWSPLWEGNLWDGVVEGFPAMSSSQCASSTMIFGDWAQVVIGEWGVLEMAVNEAANFPMGVVGFRAMYSMDVGIRYAGAFSVATSIT